MHLFWRHFHRYFDVIRTIFLNVSLKQTSWQVFLLYCILIHIFCIYVENFELLYYNSPEACDTRLKKFYRFWRRGNSRKFSIASMVAFFLRNDLGVVKSLFVKCYAAIIWCAKYTNALDKPLPRFTFIFLQNIVRFYFDHSPFSPSLTVIQANSCR